MKSISATKDGQIESDKAIISKLQKIDCLILPERITSFNLIDAETLVLIVAKAVECISGVEIQVGGIFSVLSELSTLIFSFPTFSMNYQYSGSLPPNIASRHRVCTSVAAKVKELGFSGECGYNQLLYPIESQTRALLSWLVYRLPRGQELRKEVDRNPTVVLNALITKSVTDWKSQSWRHPNCFYGVPPRNPYNIAPFQTLSVPLSDYGILDIFRESADLGISAECSILEKHALELIEESRNSPFLEKNLLGSADAIKSTRLSSNKHSGDRGSMIESAFRKYHLGKVSDSSASPLEQEKWSTKVQLDRSSCISAAIEALDLGDHEAEIARREEEERVAQIEMAVLEDKIQKASSALSALESTRDDIASRMQRSENELNSASSESTELERKILVKRRTLELIPFAHDNIIKLEDHCAASIAKAAEVVALWDEERAVLEGDIRSKKSDREKVHKNKNTPSEDEQMYGALA
jgi:coiled-coil domain-containing protein 22